MARPDPQHALDALYAVPPEAFVAKRAALAKAAKERGDREAAATILARKKPQRAAYVLNQLARTRPDDVAALVDAGRTLARVQRRALRGDAGSGLREAIAAERAVLARVTAAARTLLKELGMGEAQLPTIAGALRAALVNPAAATALEEGRLERTPGPAAGFPGADEATADDAAPPRASTHAKKAATERAATKHAATKHAAAEHAATKRAAAERIAAARRAEDAARDATRLRTAAVRAEHEARVAATRATKAATAANQAEREAREAAKRAARLPRGPRRA